MVRSLMIVVGLLLLASSAWVLYQRAENRRWRFGHGQGYWSVHELKPNRAGYWERFAHYERLFDGPVDLGLVQWFSIAPDGSRAALQRDGRVLIYDRGAGTIDTVLVGEVGPGGVSWDLSAGRLRVSLMALRGTVAESRDTVVEFRRSR